jgi:sortase A
VTPPPGRVRRAASTLFLAIGVVLLGIWGAARLHSFLGERRDRARFEERRAAARTAPSPAPTALPATPVPVTPEASPSTGVVSGAPSPAASPSAAPRPSPVARAERTVDVSLWSEERVKAWKESLVSDRREPLALLRVPRLKIDVPVLEGTDDLTLNRGAGWIEGTARPGERGNVGLSAHRDGFFRALKDIAVGDEIDLETPEEAGRYTVSWTKIVNPDDVSVLDDTPGPAITLVTCYPFYFIGSAPQRFIVRATPAR